MFKPPPFCPERLSRTSHQGSERFGHSIPCEGLWQGADLGVDGIFPFNDLARVSCHTPEDGSHRTLGTILSFIVGNIVADRVEEVIVLLLIGVLSIPPNLQLFSPRMMSPVDFGAALAAMSMLRDAVPATHLMTALAVHSGAISIFEFHRVVVKNFPVVDTHADLCTAHAIGADREVIFQPVDDIQIMNVLLGDMVSADPDEVIPVAHLVFHFGQFASVLLFQVGTLANPWGVAVPVGASRNDIT